MTARKKVAAKEAEPQIVTPTYIAEAARALLEEVLARGCTAVCIVGSAGSAPLSVGSVPNSEPAARGLIEVAFEQLVPMPG